MANVNISYLKTPTGALKIAEIVLVFVSFIILRVSIGDDTMYNFYAILTTDGLFFGVGSTVCCLIVTPLLLIIYLMGKLEVQQTIMEVALNFVFSILLFTFGGIAMHNFATKLTSFDEVKDNGLAMASFALLAAVAYLFDCILAAMKYRG